MAQTAPRAATPAKAATVGLLDGDLARSIYDGFRGKLLSGVIRQSLVPDGTTLDGNGDPQAIAPVLTAIEGFTDNYSKFTQAQAGIPATDLRLFIFAQSAPGVIPRKDSQVRLDRAGVGQWYQLRNASIDPAGALWDCQAFEIKAPV